MSRTVRAEPLALDVGDLVGGRFRLEAHLGSGDLVTTWLARRQPVHGASAALPREETLASREEGGRAVVLKILRRPDKPEHVLRFKRMYRTARPIDHPSILVPEAFENLEGEAPFMILPYVPKVATPGLLRAMSESQQITFLWTLFEAIDVLHMRGLVHGRLHQGNFLVTPAGRGDGPPAGDVTALLADPSQADVGQEVLAGPAREALHYLAPELAIGRSADGRADLYAAGVLLYLMATGTYPFAARSALELVRERFRAPGPPTAPLAGLSPVLEELIVKLLNKRPGKRFPSARSVLAYLQTNYPQVQHAVPQVRRHRLLSGEMIGREGELNELRRILDLVLKSQGHVVLISGEEGIGRSRLADEFTLFAQLEGFIPLATRCYPGSGPFGPVLSWLTQLLTHVDRRYPRTFKDRGGPVDRDDVIETIRQLRQGRDDEDEMQRQRDRLALVDHLVDLFLQLAGNLPVLMIVDDLHRADRETCEFIAHLAHRLAGSKLMILGLLLERDVTASRSRGQDQPLMLLYGLVHETDCVTAMVLERLDRSGVAALVRSSLGTQNYPSRLVDLLMEGTSGNPFFVNELLKHLIAAGLLQRVDDRWRLAEESEAIHQLPSSIVDVLSQRVDRCSDEERVVLEALAIGGGRKLEHSLLREMTEMPEDRLLDRVSELVQSDLLVEEAQPTGAVSVGFTHNKVAEIVYRRIDRDRRRRLHQRYARILLDHEGGRGELVVDELAMHFTLGGDRDQAIHYSRRAGDRARSVAAHSRAIDHYERARSLLEDQGLQGDALTRWMEISEILGDVYLAAGQDHRAFSVFTRLLAIAIDFPASRSYLAGLHRRLGNIQATHGDLEAALDHFQQALLLIGSEGDRSHLAQILLDLGACHARWGHLRRARTHIGRALKIVEDLGALGELGAAHDSLGRLALDCGDMAEAVERFETSLRIRRMEEDRVGMGYTLIHLAETDLTRGAIDEARQRAEEALEIFRQVSDLRGVAEAAMLLGILHHRFSPRWDQARKYLAEALKLRRSMGDRYQVAVTQVALAQLEADQGRISEAEERLLTARESLEKIGNPIGLAQSALALGSWHAQWGSLVKAREFLVQAQELLKDNRCHRLQAPLRAALADLYARVGNLDYAARYCEEALDQVPAEAFPYARAKIVLVQGTTARQMGRLDDAEAHIREALAVFTRFNSHLMQAHANLELGWLERARGAVDRAADTFHRAEQIYYRLGAGEFRKMAVAAARRLQEETISAVPATDDGRQELAILYRVRQVLGSIIDLEPLLVKVVEIAVETLRAERGLLALVDPNTGDLTVAASRNFDAESGELHLEYSRSVLRQCIEAGVPIVSNQLQEDDRFAANLSVMLLEIHSVACAPLRSQDNLLGCLYVDNKQQGALFSDRDLTFLGSLASQAASAIDNALLHERHKAIMEGIDEGVIAVDQTERIVAFNQAAERITGLRESEVIGQDFEEVALLIHAPLGETLRRTLEQGEEVHADMTLRRLDGVERQIELRSRLLGSPRSIAAGALIQLRDVTDLRRLEAQVRIGARLEAMGDLASKVSRRMSAYLRELNEVTGELIECFDEGDLNREYAEEIRLELADAATYIRTTLTSPVQETARKGREGSEPRQVLLEVVRRWHHRAAEMGVSLTVEAPADLPALPLAAEVLREAVSNLVVNALDAIEPTLRRDRDDMPGELDKTPPRGTRWPAYAVSLTAGRLAATAPRPEEGVPAGELVVLSVVDNGPGIPPEALEKIFDPFFTTKSSGDGLGLWQVHRAVEDCGGVTRVTSSSKGTSFTLYIPVETAARPALGETNT